MEDGRLNGLLRKEGSELGKFLTGCKNTLYGDDLNNLRNKVYNFWREKYSAEKFCIALGGKQSFEELEGYARKYFEESPVRDEVKRDSGIGYMHYDEKYMNELIKLKPLISSGMKSLDTLIITITIPETLSIYRKKVEF